MQEFCGIAINITLTELIDEKLQALAELIIITSQPTFFVDVGGEILRKREISHLRFGVTSKSVRELIKRLTEYADGMDELEGRASLKKLEETE